jgi:glutathione synthase/RimK-type ligase-like ATP-grasp enzyme
MVLILSNVNADSQKGNHDKYVSLIHKSAKSPDVAIYDAVYDELLFSISGGQLDCYDTKNNIDLKEYDIIMNRTYTIDDFVDELNLLSHYANENKISLINDYGYIHKKSKLTQSVKFLQAGVPMPWTIYLNKAATENSLKRLSFPCIMKDVNGSYGDNNYLVDGVDKIVSIKQQYSNTRFILQEFIPNDGDLRVLMVGSRHLIIGRKATDSSHLNNTSKGGAATIINGINVDILDDCQKIMQTFGRTIAGIDVIINSETSQHYFLELNSQPQVTTGAFVDEKVELFRQFFNQQLT